MFDWSGATGLTTLFVSAFVSATVLPGNSEIVLLAVLKSLPEHAATAIFVATLGNTLGGFTTYGLGRLFPRRLPESRALAWVERHGAAVLLLSWLPIVGDALCAAAGWLRVSWPASLAALALGKLARYLAVAQAVALF